MMAIIFNKIIKINLMFVNIFSIHTRERERGRDEKRVRDRQTEKRETDK